MKNLFTFSALFLLICLTAFPAQAQGKNQIAVRTRSGANVPGIAVHVYEGGATPCKCDGNSCVVNPVDSDVTDKNGLASFNRPGRNQPRLKPNTLYKAAIDDKCQSLRACSNSQQDCQYAGAFHNFTTDKNGKFDGFQITR